METPRLTLITLISMCVLILTIINGEEVELKVRAGENITLYCDRSFTTELIVWIRNCSHENQPSLEISYKKTDMDPDFQTFSFIHISSSISYDLHITNISASNLGLYYCATTENKVNKDEKGIISQSTVYNYGNRRTRLSLEETSYSGLLNITSSCPAVSDCVFCWTLLGCVCSVCVLLFSICVYCLFLEKSTDAVTDKKWSITGKGNDEDVFYSMSRRQKLSKAVQHSDYSTCTYVQVRTQSEES